MGEMTNGSSLTPWLRLYGPGGILLDSFTAAAASEVTARASNSGVFTVIVADGSGGAVGSGPYRLTLAKTGDPIVVSAGDEGGPLTNGMMHTGTIDVGDLDVWNFTANIGDNLVVRMGEMTNGSPLTPWLRLYGPGGVLLDSFTAVAASEVSARATNSGVFTVVAADANGGLIGSGPYRLTLARSPGSVVVSAGDEGGPLTGAGVYQGTIEVGDLDVWTFSACAGDNIALRMDELTNNSPITPWIRLYGRDGTLLNSVSGAATAQINRSALSSGNYTVVLADGSGGLGGSGAYTLTVNGLTGALKVCVPIISGVNVSLCGVGGTPNASFLLLTATNLTTPA